MNSAVSSINLMTKTELNLSCISVLGSYRNLWIYYNEVIILFLNVGIVTCFAFCILR